MKIKSLLIGSAALMTASTAYAADPIVYAEPEPVEYVRVCDVYGAGFFYIPGTETCLRIGGYARFEVQGNFNAGGGYGTRARFAPQFDVRTDTEWGTVRGFAEFEFNYDNNFAAVGALQYYNMPHAFIELTNSTGTLRLGHTQRPYARFLSFGSGNVYGGTYGYGEQNEISYTFGGANGFSAIVALVDDNAFNWMPDVEAGVNFKQGWGSIGAIAGYDESTGGWGAKAVLRFTAPNSGFSGGLHVFYSSNVAGNSYGIADSISGIIAPWSILAHVKSQFTPTVAGTLAVQWFDRPAPLGDAWEAVAGLDITPVGMNEAGGAATFRIRPEIRYRNTAGVSAWNGIVRFDRNF